MPNRGVRLHPDEQQTIIDTVLHCAQAASVRVNHLFLYGSRADLDAKGGDIDLWIECEQCPDRAFKTALKLSLYDQIGEQKIDLLLTGKNQEKDSKTEAFLSMIQSQGVFLWKKK